MRKETLDILIVDDQPGVRYLLEILVKEFGHRVHTAENGLVAIERVRQIHPDVIFMDVRMPLMDGLEALRRIRRITSDTIVIIMSAYLSEQTIEQALKNGAFCCMAKPFDIEKVKALIQDLTWHRKQKYFWDESYVI
ncbi:response regulator [Desulfofundulus thermosubterraneus]|uniref:Stage 0 sporulation protein A homolog n=1 Tax=Desulfofundulus thermosubterraneus DSM 16057 TaxID=1121432 RepID=A0A1M6JLR9_9FIRM|nr:response regulator [Desulfofundulus thermosubterraneus]SHJ47626.1 two-component system, response regulator, stage 0 sporulation protein F [Desulfofundulus thermosubterraneus DSM 16057]